MPWRHPLCVLSLLAPLCLAGCVASGGIPGAPPRPGQADSGPTPSAAPSVPAGHALLTLRVAWPTPVQATARTVLTSCTAVRCTVTWPEMDQPEQAVIQRPECTGRLAVPPGRDRLITLEQLDAEGTHLAATDYALPELFGGQTYPITFHLLDDLEPDNDWSHATPMLTDETESPWAVLEDDSDADAEDWFSFVVTRAPNAYAFRLNHVQGDGTRGIGLTVVGADGSTVLREAHSSSPGDVETYWLFPENGTYYVCVEGYGGSEGHLEYRLAISDADGEAMVDVGIQ